MLIAWKAQSRASGSAIHAPRSGCRTHAAGAGAVWATTTIPPGPQPAICSMPRSSGPWNSTRWYTSSGSSGNGGSAGIAPAAEAGGGGGGKGGGGGSPPGGGGGRGAGGGAAPARAGAAPRAAGPPAAALGRPPGGAVPPHRLAGVDADRRRAAVVDRDRVVDPQVV